MQLHRKCVDHVCYRRNLSVVGPKLRQWMVDHTGKHNWFYCLYSRWRE
jgi:hypothetical protein